MDFENKRFGFRVVFLFASTLMVFPMPALFGQPAQSTESNIDIKTLIQRAYQSSTTAKTNRELTETIQQCDQALALSVSDPQEQYLRQLKSWALVSRAKLYGDGDRNGDPDKNGDRNKLESSSEPDSDSVRAIQDCTQAIAEDSNNWKAYAHRASRYCEGKKYQLAVEDLGAAIRRQPQDSKLWFNRAELLYQLGQYEVAVADYTRVVELDSADLQAFTGRAHSYVQLAKFELALADYDRVIERTQKSARAFLNRADLHLRMRNFKLAGQDYREALTRDQELAQAYRGVAWMYATSHQDQYYNPTVADRSIKRAIELDGRETIDNLVVLAAAQASAGEYTMARDTIKRVRGELASIADQQQTAVTAGTKNGSASRVSNEVQEKLNQLEASKWFRAGTGK